MKIGYVGAGKLGMPVAAAVAQKHDVVLYDVDKSIYARWGDYPFEESAEGTVYPTLNALMEAGRDRVTFAASVEALRVCDLIFVAVQTPHDARYEGTQALPSSADDFDYSHLSEALEALAGAHMTCPVVVISTCLPGTYAREFAGLDLNLVYNPYFIAMGTVVRDFLDPEFILCGGVPNADLRQFYASFGLADRMRWMTVTSAEATKVFYNTFISMKLSFANTVAEACEAVGANCDDVMGALKAANKRLISGAYLDPGMGDGGGCHPRDNIALSWFAEEHGLSFDFFGMLMKQREAQADKLAEAMVNALQSQRVIGIVGFAFKANSNITTGSHAALVANLLNYRYGYDPDIFDRFVNGEDPKEAGVYLIGCRHDYVRYLRFAPGSVVIDPWGIVRDQEGVSVRRIGRA